MIFSGISDPEYKKKRQKYDMERYMSVSVEGSTGLGWAQQFEETGNLNAPK